MTPPTDRPPADPPQSDRAPADPPGTDAGEGQFLRAAILVVSDSAAAGTHEDLSGPEAERILTAWGVEVRPVEILPDDRAAISARLAELCDGDAADLVITAGGTGFAPRDVTPEATREILDREAPGLAEFLRAESARRTPFAWLGRGVAGIRGKTLVVNLPGRPQAVVESLESLRPLLPHAVRLVRNEDPGHPPRPRRGDSGS